METEKILEAVRADPRSAPRLAADAGVSIATVARIRSPRCREWYGTLRTLRKLAAAVGVER